MVGENISNNKPIICNMSEKDQIVQPNKEKGIVEKEKEISVESVEISINRKEDVVSSHEIGTSKGLFYNDPKDGNRIYRSPLLGENEALVSCMEEGKFSLTENLEYVCDKFTNRNMYAFRKVVKEHIEHDVKTDKNIVTYEMGGLSYLTYGQVHHIIRSFASGLRIFDPALKSGSFIETCKEWIPSAHACFMNSFTVITCYANLGVDALVHVINECSLRTLICESKQLKMFENKIADKCPSLKNLIVVGNNVYTSKRFNVRNWFDVLADGEKNMLKEAEFVKPKGEDLAFIMYTSGTTGIPKGVLITHRNLVSSSGGIRRLIEITEEDVHLCYLPLAHSMELVLHHIFIFSGCLVYFGTPRTLIAKKGGAYKFGDIEVAKPTIFIGVPRVGVTSKLRNKPGIARIMFYEVYKKKLEYLEKFENEKTVPLENLVFGKLRKLLGGRLRVIVSGSAPFSKECHQFLQAAVGVKCVVVQGYGLTETCSCGTAQDTSKYTGTGIIGNPKPCVEIKLINVPELGYKVTDIPAPRGEILIRGPPVCSLGYYKKKELTEEVFQKDGWFRTGDIGKYNQNNHTFSIIDRRKNLVKLSQGEYIAVENLEVLYSSSAFCAPNGLCICPNSLKSYICAVMITEPVYTLQWAKENGINSNEVDEIIKIPLYKQQVLEQFAKIGKRYGKKTWETIQDVVIFNEQWTPENGCTTAALKLKRRSIADRYKTEIEELYEEEKKTKIVIEKKDKDSYDYPEYYELWKPSYVN